MFHRHHLLLLTLLLVVFGPVLFFSGNGALQTSAATIPVTGWAWSHSLGWISFSSSNCDSENNGVGDGKIDIGRCEGTGVEPAYPYGVNINGTQLTGYAWSSNIGGGDNGRSGGYISFGPDSGSERAINLGSDNPPDDPAPVWAEFDNNSSTKIKGWARACTVYANNCSGALKSSTARGGWDGWIRMSGPGYQVMYNPSNNPKPDGYGCDIRDKFSVGGNSFYGCAWGGGEEGPDPEKDNRSPQFPGWIAFNYHIVPATPTCSDGVMNGSETGVDCGGPSCSACPIGGGVGGSNHCTDGVFEPTLETGLDCGGQCPACTGGAGGNSCVTVGNSNGVVQKTITSGPLCITACQLERGSLLASTPVDGTAQPNGSYIWRLYKYDGTTINPTVVWNEKVNGVDQTINPACSGVACQRNYSNTDKVTMSVKVGTGAGALIEQCSNRGTSFAFNDASSFSSKGIIVVQGSEGRLNAKFGTSNIAPVTKADGTPVAFIIGDINNHCNDSKLTFKLLNITDITNGSPMTLGTMEVSFNKAVDGTQKMSTFANSSDPLIMDLKLKTKSSWVFTPAHNYRVNFEVSIDPAPGCAPVENPVYSSRDLFVGTTGGDIIEQ
ncbi:MAG: hypothetical protein WCO84_01820 [bacterium]